MHALDLYPDHPLRRLFQQPYYRMGGIQTRVLPAPDPSTILWENLGATAFGPLDAEQMREIDEILGRQTQATFALTKDVQASLTAAGAR